VRNDELIVVRVHLDEIALVTRIFIDGIGNEARLLDESRNAVEREHREGTRRAPLVDTDMDARPGK
jgi:hypothetical protein